MRVGSAWFDVCIRNMSSRGLLVEAASPPARGTYLEIRRGARVIVARSVWVDDGRCGLRTQDRLTIDEFTNESNFSGAEVVDVALACSEGERRPLYRAADIRHDHNRMLSRFGEFAAIASIGGFLAYLAAATLQEAFARPLSVATAAIGGVN